MAGHDLRQYLEHLGFGSQVPTPAVLKARWKELCIKHHPDKGGSPDEFVKVTHAYKMLTDTEYRQKHIMREILHGRPNAGGDLNIRVHIPVSFEDAFFGKRMVVSYSPMRFTEDFKLETAGDKYHAELLTEVLDIPPGSVRGYEFLKEGCGHRHGEEGGNAVFSILPQPHPFFKVENDDVISEEQLALEVMLKGGVVDVMTMYGIKTVKIPAGTQPGARLKIKNCGVPPHGNHLVVVTPVFPTTEELKSHDSWKALGIDWEDDKEARDEQAEAMHRMFITLGGMTFGTAGTTAGSRFGGF
jgi:DnaJ-class molecular chaperone